VITDKNKICSRDCTNGIILVKKENRDANFNFFNILTGQQITLTLVLERAVR
jgi:predicted nucleic acid-binding Zn ribbon protein